MTRLDRRDASWLIAAILLGVGVRVAYVLVTQHVPLAGDAPEYDTEGQLIAAGHLFWTRLPYGILHAGAWKAPGYPAWLGFWYAVLGHHVLVPRLAQALVGTLNIPLVWVLGRRLFSRRVAAGAALLVAIYPLAWQYDGLLYPESIATPLTLAIVILMLTGKPSPRRALTLGALLGILLLVRPSAEFLILGVLVAWWGFTGWRRGIAMTALAAGTAVLIVAPWTIRNAIVMHGFVPISMQDAALYGTFNRQSAADPVYPYAWRRSPPSVADLFRRTHPLSDIALRSALIHRGVSYISAHPGSLPAAFFWNGLSRLWDVRRRSRSLSEVRFEGRSKFVTNVGLDVYSVLLPLALVGLWRARRRRAVVGAALGLALGASVVFTVDAGTRYRAPLEPLIALFACVGVLGAAAEAGAAAQYTRSASLPESGLSSAGS